jgi:ABC-type multidrug transport system permease subunit
VVVVSGGGSDPAAERVAAALRADPGLAVTVAGARAADETLRRGGALAIVRPGDPPVVAFDPERPGARAAAEVAQAALARAGGRRDVVLPRDEVVSAPGRRYIDFLIPGLLGMSLMSGGVWGVGWALVQTRIRRLLKRMVATPMNRGAFLLSYGLHRVVVSLVEIVFLLAFGWVAFGVEVRGSPVAVLAVGLAGVLSFSGIGLLIASRAQNVETANGLMNLATLPMWVLSGVFFSTSNFPDWARPAIDALPLTALNDGLRAVVNEGRSLAACAAPLGVMLAWGVGCFLIALRVFRWQ